MTPKKLRILLILAILCIVLFGTLFRMMTSSTNNEQLTTNNTYTTSGNQELGTGELGTVTTGTITDITGTITNLPPSEGGTQGGLTILMPGRFYNDGFQQLAQLLKSKDNLIIRYKKIDNLGYYKKIIEGTEKIDGIDLYLVPTDWLAGYQGKQIALNEDMAPYVNSIFVSLEKGRGSAAEEGFAFATGLFIPYAIDPLVTLTPSSTTLNSEDELTFQNIADFITQDSETNKIKMPLLRGIDKNDKKILDLGNESYPDYFIITYNIIDQVYNAGQESNYNIIVDTINNPSISKRSYANFKITFNKLLKKNPNCITFPDICILAYNLGDIKFGFVSDASIEQQYFGGTGERITDLTFYNFPTTSKEYPVRGRGFVADKNTHSDKAIQTFAQEYTKAGAGNSLPLRQDTLSAFNAVLDIQKTQKKYAMIFKFEPEFSLMLYPANLQEQFLKNTNFIPMIQEKNPASGVGGFFDTTSRSR